MRAFIATRFESKELERIRNQFYDMNGLKVAHDFHLTYKFLGEISDDELAKTIKRLKQVKMKKFKVALDRIGVFPDMKYPNVIWVGITGKEIYGLQKEIDDKLHGLFEKEEKFKAHVTIARVKFVDDRNELMKKLKTSARYEQLDVKEFQLIKSELKADKPEYTVIESFGLD